MSEVVFSVADPYYDQIAQGIKTVEFRRRWSLSSSTAYIYRSGKKRHICAYIELGAPVKGTAVQMKKIAEEKSPCSASGIARYLPQGGCAMPIKRFVEFEPIPLDEMRACGVHPPQQFIYLHRYPALQSLIYERTANCPTLTGNDEQETVEDGKSDINRGIQQ